MPVLNEPVDVSRDFEDHRSTYFLADRLLAWDSETRTGSLRWKRHVRKLRFAFNQAGSVFEEAQSWSFPPDYQEHPELQFRVDPVSARTVRIRIQLKPTSISPLISGILVSEVIPDTDGQANTARRLGDIGGVVETEESVVLSTTSL
ncbi:MAG: hypothetical protein KAU31_16550, partial [Spirochaetaceae bacterium]|nr:hypothetical protein [Spirochaetaceae bacterium]